MTPSVPLMSNASFAVIYNKIKLNFVDTEWGKGNIRHRHRTKELRRREENSSYKYS